MDKFDHFFLGLGIGVAVGLRFHEIEMAIEQKQAVDLPLMLPRQAARRPFWTIPSGNYCDGGMISILCCMRARYTSSGGADRIEVRQGAQSAVRG
jgi:hypothetical protein